MDVTHIASIDFCHCCVSHALSLSPFSPSSLFSHFFLSFSVTVWHICIVPTFNPLIVYDLNKFPDINMDTDKRLCWERTCRLNAAKLCIFYSASPHRWTHYYITGCNMRFIGCARWMPNGLASATAIFVVVDYFFLFYFFSSQTRQLWRRSPIPHRYIRWNRIDHTNHVLATFVESKNRSSFCAIYV